MGIWKVGVKLVQRIKLKTEYRDLFVANVTAQCFLAVYCLFGDLKQYLNVILTEERIKVFLIQTLLSVAITDRVVNRGRPLIGANRPANVPRAKSPYSISGLSQLGIKTLSENLRTCGVFNQKLHFLDEHFRKDLKYLRDT